MAKIKVLIADKHPAFREWLSRIVTAEKDLELIGQAVDGEDAVNQAQALKPDVVVLDMGISKLSSIEVTKQIREYSPDTAVLIISSINTQTHAISVLRAGAAGYLTKDTPDADIRAAIRLAHQGEGIIDREVAAGIARHLRSEKDGRKVGLDLYTRELEVLKMVAKGFRNKEIALKLEISERTVQAHLSNIFSKMEVDSRTEAVLEGLKTGLLEIEDLKSIDQ